MPNFYNLPYDAIIIITEFLESTYSLDDVDTKNFINSSRHVGECLNQVARHDLVRISNLEPCITPYNYFSLFITADTPVKYVKYIRANYPKLKLAFMLYDISVFSDFDYQDFAKNPYPYDYLTYHSVFTDISHLRDGDISPEIQLTDKSDITIKHYGINILHLVRCKNIKIVSKYINKLQTEQCENINTENVHKIEFFYHLHKIDAYRTYRFYRT